MNPHIIIPWRDGCPHRKSALEYVLGWWAIHHPEWPVTLGPWPEEHGPWRKGRAVRAARIPDSTDVVIVTDADVLPLGIGETITALGNHRWAMPFRTVYRLTESGTAAAQQGMFDWTNHGCLADQAFHALTSERYVGSPGGGTVVLKRRIFDEIPIDPRFAGYGHEDLSWSLALHMLAGAPLRTHHPLIHLWHPPQPRIRSGNTVSRGIGSEASMALWNRYREASTRASMEALVMEANNVLRASEIR